MMPMEAKKSFKLFEVAKHTYTVPGGFYRGSFAIIMNQDSFDRLDEADQAALDAIFGENLARMAGKAWDEIDTAGMESLQSNADNSFTEASAEDAAKWQALTGPLIEKGHRRGGRQGCRCRRCARVHHQANGSQLN